MKINQKRCYFLCILLLLIFCILLVPACSLRESSIKEPQQIKIHKNENGLYEVQDGSKIYKDLKILNSCESLSNSNIKSAVIYGTDWQAVETSKHAYKFPLLAVASDKTTMLLQLDEVYVYPPEVYIQNIDGDETNEIIVKSTLGDLRETGLRIFKLADNKIVELYCFPEFPFIFSENYQYGKLNFGFTSNLMDNYKLIIKYPEKDFENIIDVSSDFAIENEYYDTQGKLKQKTDDIVHFGCFMDFQIEDVDEDGICEIIGHQGMSTDFSKMIGSMLITLKYSSQSKTMEVMSIVACNGAGNVVCGTATTHGESRMRSPMVAVPRTVVAHLLGTSTRCGIVGITTM